MFFSMWIFNDCSYGYIVIFTYRDCVQHRRIFSLYYCTLFQVDFQVVHALKVTNLVLWERRSYALCFISRLKNAKYIKFGIDFLWKKLYNISATVKGQ